MEVVTHIEHIVKRQYDEAILAKIGWGNTELVKNMLHIHVTEVRYYQMKKYQKEKNEKCFFNVEVKSDNVMDRNLAACLKYEITSVPYQTLKGIFSKVVT